MNTKSGKFISTAVRVRAKGVNEDLSVNVLPDVKMVSLGITAVPSRADQLLFCGYPQEAVFEKVAKPLLDKFLKAEDSVSLIAFGPRFSGKTFTLFGPGATLSESAMLYGIYPRLASYLFSLHDQSLFVGKNPQIKVLVSFFEIDGPKLKNLLKNSTLPRTADVQKHFNVTQEHLVNLEYEVCTSARQMIHYLNVALHNKGANGTHVFANVVIEQPYFQEGQCARMKTSAVFADLGGNEYEAVQVLYILSALAATHGEREDVLPQNWTQSHLYNCLKASVFKGERSVLAFCCLPPSLVQAPTVTMSLEVLDNIIDMQQRVQEVSRNVNNLDAIKTSSSLISQAESLLSKLSMSPTVSDEDREQLRKWFHLKKECEDSLNAQSHGQLECIEEVTESEEEIASSDEKMSESPVSLDSSLSESDQEEGDSKVCQLSDNNFSISLDNMCAQFYSFVDKFVDSFKARTSVSPVKERKSDYSAARRGGMSELPKVQELHASRSNGEGSVEKLRANENGHHTLPSTMSSMGCRRKEIDPPRTKEHERKKRSVGNEHFVKADEEKMKKLTKEPSDESEEDNEQQGHNPENAITWSIMDLELQDSTLLRVMKRYEDELRKIRLAYTKLAFEAKERGLKGKTQEKELDMERTNQMYFAVTGIESMIELMKFVVIRDPNGDDDDINQIIRYHRQVREDFTKHKNRLSPSVKNKTATDEELRDHLMADEMIDILDSSIEFLNYITLKKKPIQLKLPNTAVCRAVIAKLEELSPLETKNIMFKYFIKSVDMREGAMQLETAFAENLHELEMAYTKISSLSRTLQHVRNEYSKVVTTPRDTASGGQGPSTTLALPEGNTVNRIPGRIPGRRGPCIPHQNLSKLQATSNDPPTRVTINKNKLVIESKPSNQHKPNSHHK